MTFAFLKPWRNSGLLLAFVLLLSIAGSAHDGIHEQIIAVSKEIKGSPKDAALYLKRAELYRLHADWTRSERDYRRAERLDPSLVAVDLGRGKLWLDAGQLVKSQKALVRYLSNVPKSFEGTITMARVFAKLKQTDNAISHFSKAIALAPGDSAEIYLERSNVLLTARRLDEALRGLDEGIKKLGGLITLQTAAIDMEIKAARFDRALARLDAVMADMPRKETFLFRRAEILLKARRPCEARESLIASKNGFDQLPAARRNVVAVKAQLIQLQTLLSQPSLKNCPNAR